MRRIVNLTNPKDRIVRLMIHNTKFGTYLFGYNKLEDCGGEWDEWYESDEIALESCKEHYGVSKSDWQEIPNPEPHCQQDWINPVRVKGRKDGKPDFSKIEKLIQGKWVEFSVNQS